MSEKYNTDYTYGISDGLLAHGPPTLTIIILLYYFLDYNSYIKLSSSIIFFAYISDYFHTHIHLKNTWLDKYKFFLKNYTKFILIIIKYKQKLQYNRYEY